MALRANNKGQGSLPEYVVTFFVVVAAGVAMTTYIQRSLQAKIRDSRDYMRDIASKECDANCQTAAGIKIGKIPREYEPYYSKADSQAERNSEVKAALVPRDKIFMKKTSDNSEVDTSSKQFPPIEAAKDNQ